MRSHEVELVQLADIIIGAISYYCREDINSVAKFTIMNKINKMAKAITNKDISETTNYCSKKFNILRIKLDGDESCE